MAQEEKSMINGETMGESIWGDLPASAFVESSHLFKSLSQDGRRFLISKGRLFKFDGRKVICNEGEKGDRFYLIKSGNVQVTTIRDSDRKKIELATLGRGAVFGEVALLTGQKRTATITALNTVETIAFMEKDIQTILKTFPKVKLLLNALLKSRAQKTIEKTTAR